VVGPLAGAQAATADDAPVPEQVAGYFATGLVPRLIDLYGSGAGTEDTTKVGGISRVFVWSDGFLAGRKGGDPTTFTNDWVAPVTIGDKPFGLATVWINPSTELPELAGVDLGSAVVTAVERAPEGSILVHDSRHSAWFALKDDVLTPLVPGTSGVSAATSPVAAQAVLAKAAPVGPRPGVNYGLLIAGGTLGMVVLALAGFVLLPDRRRRHPDAPDDTGPQPT
jgi:hypothetical protein